ncbi:MULTISPECIES: AAA family ATPase [unclassified Sporosarcina]|uniref:AAA family ATPase n=1 Tax=unclassified Sporosarcina TaxID=2647733 RepID=UPI00164DE3F4|nr:uridine kinase [Sporosarcina sp. resist]QNK89246.1 uridine kinase [Sporosarcina sp. resist]
MKNHSKCSMLIGIDGLGGSGKTMYAYKLQQQLEGSVILHLDDFVHKKEVRYNENYEEWYCYYHLQWRYDYLIQKLLLPLKSGLDVNETIEVYNRETDSYILREIEIPAGTTVIVEGVFLQRPELRPYFEIVVYLELDQETRLKRITDRDIYMGNKKEIALKYDQRYFPAEEKYIEQCNPLALADIVENEVKEGLV